MWHLVKRNGLFYLGYILPFLLFSTLYWISEKEAVDAGFVAVQLFWMWVFASGSISTSEQYEMKHNGYAFLEKLPLTDREIVTSRFLLVFFAILSLVIFNMFLFSFFKVSPSHLKLIRVFVLISGSFSLLLAGLLYLGVFKFGFSRMLKYFWIIAFAGAAIMIGSIEFLLPKIKDRIPAIISTLTGIPLTAWLLVTVLVVYLYHRLMLAAVRAKIAARG